MVPLPANEWPALTSNQEVFSASKEQVQVQLNATNGYVNGKKASNGTIDSTLAGKPWRPPPPPTPQYQPQYQQPINVSHQPIINAQKNLAPPPGLRPPLRYLNGAAPISLPQGPMYNTPALLRQQHQFSIPIAFNSYNGATFSDPIHMYSNQVQVLTSGNVYTGPHHAFQGPTQNQMHYNTQYPQLIPALVPPHNIEEKKEVPIRAATASKVVSPPSVAPTLASSSPENQDVRSRSLSSVSTMTSPRTAQYHVEEGKMSNDEPLDKYASTYVPTWLREVNEDRQFNLIPLPDEPNYDYDAFVSSFLPRKLVFSDPDDDVLDMGKRENILEGEEEQKIDLVRVDATWLKGNDDELQGELEVENEGNKDDTEEKELQKPLAHASIGAHSQAQDGEEGGNVVTAGTTMLHTTFDAVPSAPLPPFSLKMYAERLRRLLELEFTHRREVLASQSLFNIQMNVFPEEKTSTPAWSKEHLYSFKLPGIREDYPNLVTGDLLQLRVLASNSYSWLRLALEAKVYAVHKVAGIVIVKCDALATTLKDLFSNVQSARFNVLFSSSTLRGSVEISIGVKRIGRHLEKQKSNSGKVLKRWLFPCIGDQEAYSQDNKVNPNIDWFDKKLNAEQKGVVENISFTNRRKIPFLIHGPPGTGKTKTLVETTLQILQHQKNPRIILTAPSVTAADTLALRLAPHLNPNEMTRINDPRRTFEEVPEALLIYCVMDQGSNGESSRFGLPEWEKLMKTKVIIMATQDIHILHLCKVSNLELGRWQGVTLSTMLGNVFKHSARLHWTHLLVDEAGQSSEAEISNALLLVVPSSYHDCEESLPTVVLCGDVAQLGPQIDSHYARSHGLDVSLLERLSKRKVYHRQLSALRLQARQSLLRGDYGPDKMGYQNGDDDRYSSGCAAHLVRNYRARNASLLHVVSMLFYDDCLLPCAPPSTLDLSLWSFPNGEVPLLFNHIDSKDEWVDEGASFYNTEEIDRVVKLCQSLTGRGSTQSKTALVAAKDIAVITPYREQVWRIRIKLRKLGLAAISVGNVEVYQGAEHRVTIVSTVRSTRRFLEVDAKRSLGVMFERKRLCVAISRAQEALIIVGNAKLLGMDPYWRALISYSKRNKTIRGLGDGDDDEDVEGGQVGALENSARVGHADEQSVLERERDTAYLAGRMAASALYEEDDEEGEEEEEEVLQ